MYPRNSASPERIAIGPVVQISDGAVQTSGVSIKVKPQGGSAAAGEGTTSYEEGVVGYIPTQAETNYTSFQIVAYKSGCIPAGVTVVTSAAAVAGKVVPADDSITASVFDESTAFPLKSADTGSTQVARTGADSDTLETLSDQLDAQLTQADVRSAVGLASANLDTQLGDLPTNAELSTAMAAADDAVLAAIGDLPTAAEIVTAVKAFEVETGISFLVALKRMLAESSGKVSVSGNTVTFRDVTDSRDQIVATTDANGQRTAITYNDS